MKEKLNKYRDSVLNFAGKGQNFVDSGQIFKKGYAYYFYLISIGIFLGGVFQIFMGIFEDNVYIDLLDRFETGMIVRSVIASIFTFILSIVLIIIVALIFFKRSSDLGKREYKGALEYIYKEVTPTIIKIYGETLAVIPIFLSLISFFSVLFVAVPYTPFHNLSTELFRTSGLTEAVRLVSSNGSEIDRFGQYLEYFFKLGIGSVFIGLLLSFSILVLTHIALEVYQYLITIISNLIKFIPKFAIPLWVQKSDRNNSKPTIDIKDL